MTRQQGFTLVEMLVALAIFAMLAVAGGGIVQQSLAAREGMANAHQRLAALQMARSAIKADLARLVARPARTPYGGREETLFWGGEPLGDGPVLAFMRGGWDNPGALEARGGLQYVEYRLREGRLIRQARLRPDPTNQTPVREQILLEGVTALELSFLSRGQWAPAWRVASLSGRLPEAVALDFELAGIGPVRQLFLTAQGGE
ncbi:MAG: type II secretion system minor pseudopilin GspJ [Sphingomonadales bacterium]